MRETYPQQVDEDSHALPCYLNISSTGRGRMGYFTREYYKDPTGTSLKNQRAGMPNNLDKSPHNQVLSVRARLSTSRLDRPLPPTLLPTTGP